MKKPRTPEAARLEADYLARVREALGSRREAEAAEIVQSVVEHIEEAVAELKGPDVTLVQMAQVIERLGPPRTFAEGSEARGREGAPAGGLSPDRRERFVALLDRIWVASLVKTAGIFIPFIDFYVCTLIGHGMLARVLRPSEGLPDEFRSLGRLCWIVVFACLVHVPLSVLALYQPLAGLLALPMGAVLVAVPLVVYWRLLGGIASILRTAAQNRVAMVLLDTRRVYVTIQVIVIVIAFVIGGVIGFATVGRGRDRMSLELSIAVVGLLMLPVHWVLSYFFLLRPLSRARKALAEPLMAVEVGLAQAP